MNTNFLPLKSRRTVAHSPKNRRRTILATAILAGLIVAASLSLRSGWFQQPAQAASANSPSGLTPADNETRSRAAENFGKLPLNFVENRGQMDKRVAYYVQGRDKTVYFTNQGLTFALNGSTEAENSQSGRYALKLDFVNARADVRPEGREQTGATFSYFKGSRSQWNAGLKSYSQVVYRDLWPGIDLVYDGTVNRMKYSFVVKPGADPNQIKLAWRGASAVKINDAGELEVKSPAGGFTDEHPVSFQQADGRQVEVATKYQIETEKSAIRNSQSAITYGLSLIHI